MSCAYLHTMEFISALYLSSNISCYSLKHIIATENFVNRVWPPFPLHTILWSFLPRVSTFVTNAHAATFVFRRPSSRRHCWHIGTILTFQVSDNISRLSMEHGTTHTVWHCLVNTDCGSYYD